MQFKVKDIDVAVIGGGHAGIESALAASRLGCKTVMFTISLDFIGNMPCNPSIGGTSKGHLVREIDALGGQMGKSADFATIQTRMLNVGKGPAVHSLRAQIDRRKYSEYMKNTCEKQENLDIKQAEIVSLTKNDDGLFVLTTKLDEQYTAKKVILATGTFLGGRVYVGDKNYESGPDGMFPSAFLPDSLFALGVNLRRFKTGTPSRVNKNSIDFSDLEIQPGDEHITPFSFETDYTPKNDAVCYIAYTNDDTKKVILDNIDRSPLYSGQIEGIGPRYCPSFEDKVMRFPDKKRHQLFIEPCGENTQEMYLQGMSSSMPVDVQLKFLRTIKGLENVEVERNAYAIEYWCVDPLSLDHTLQFMDIPGLYGAGQFNGSSGYEEAAAQGLVAGINAALSVKNEKKMELDRASSYIGTLVDDLVTKGCNEPYRMMTSRSEYRLYLRQDNADLRLTETGYRVGLISEKRYKKLLAKKEKIADEIERVKHVTVAPCEELNEKLISFGTTPLTTGVKLAELIKRPQVKFKDILEFDLPSQNLDEEIIEQVEIELKYEGYIKMQTASINEMRRKENQKIDKNIDYTKIENLRLEAREKLQKVRPESIGQAERISGVSPSDIAVLIVYLQRNSK